ncbi:hypothetical protein BDZ45DRAFT_754641 [Acephala macrosclerotiorum]|nr:hypothetical protein BDZ45DRAFT_754641 [Acephala macrosclerotiorum]
MDTFAFKPYTYVPTSPRSKSAISRRKPASKPVSIFDKLQRTKPSSTELSTPQSAAAASELGIRAFGVGDATAEERGGSLDNNESAPGGNSGDSLDPIVLLGNDDSIASEAEVDDGGLHAESAAADEGLLDNPETAIESTTPAPPSDPDVWHDIDDFPETAQPSRRSERKPSTSDSMRSHTSSSSRASSEPLHDHTSAAGQFAVRARSEATMCSFARRYQPSLCARASTENQPLHGDHPHTGRSSAGEHELEVLGSTLDTDPVDKGKRQQQELEQRDDGPQQEVNDLAAVVTTECVDDIYPSDEYGSPRPALLRSCDPLPKSSHDEAGDRSDGDRDNDLDYNKADPEDDEEPRLMKRKRPSSSHDGPMQKKRKRHPKQKSTGQHRPHSKLHRRSSKSHSPPNQASRVTAVSSAESRLPSPALSAPQAMDTEMPSDCSNLSGSSSDILPTLTEVTFRPHSTRCCSFTAVVQDGCDGRGVSFSQLTQLIESIGHVGEIDDFTIKPIEQHSFLLTGFSRHTSSRLSSAVEADRVHGDTTRSRPQHGRTVDAVEPVAPRGSESLSSDHDGGLSDSDPDLSSDDDGCSSEDEQRRSSTRKNIPWDPIDEQRLLAYRKEGKPWDWIFGKFPGRTRPAPQEELPLPCRFSVPLKITYFPALSWTCYVTRSNDDLPSLEELSRTALRSRSSTEASKTESTVQRLEQPALNRAGLQIDQTQPGLGRHQGGSRVILDDNDSNEAGAVDEAEGTSGDVDAVRIERDASPHNTFATSELASGPTKSIDASGPWYDVEEGCYIKEPAPGLGPCEQQRVPSAPAQARSQTLSQSSTPLQHQTNLQSVGSITRSTSVESAVHSLLKPFDNSDDGWTDDSMAELERELELALEEQGNSSSASAPTSSHPRSVEAPQDEIQSRERSETPGSRPEELQDTSRYDTAQGLEEWGRRETEVVVEGGGVAMQEQEEPAAQKEEPGQPPVGDQQDLADAGDPKDNEATEALPATQLEIREIVEHRFRLRGIRARQLAGRQTKTTQYRVVWGEHPNRSDSWFNEDDVQISMPCEPYSQDLALQVDIFRVCGTRFSLRKGRKVFEYLVDMFGLDSGTWTTEDQLRISLSPRLVAELKGFSPHPMSQAQREVLLRHSATPISDEHRHTSRASRSSSTPADPVLGLVGEPATRKRGHQDMHTKISNDNYHSVNTDDSHNTCDTSDEDPRPAKRRKPRPARADTSADAAAFHDAGAHSKMHSATVRPRTKHVPWEPEEDAKILEMREVDGCSWEEIHAALPHRKQGTIQVRYYKKLKK